MEAGPWASTRASNSALPVLDDYFPRIGAVRLLSAADEVRLAQAIEAGHHAKSRLSGQGVIDTAEQAHLEEAVRAGIAARDRFIAANLRLVARIAADMPRPGHVPLADMIQDGNIGLIRAVDGFDWRRGHRFSTYATLWIRQAIQRGAVHTERVIPLPYALHNAKLKTAAATSRFLARQGREPSVEELAKATRLPEAMVDRALSAPSDPTSLERHVGHGAKPRELGEFVAVDTEDPADIVVQQLALEEIVQIAAALLDDVGLRVLNLRYGLHGEEPMGYREIGAAIGVNREKARQILVHALKELQRAMELPA